MGGSSSLRRFAPVLPALILIVVGLDAAIDIPHQDTLVVALAVLCLVAMLLLVGRSSPSAEDDGFLTVTGSDEDTGMPNLQMQINRTPDELMEKQHIRLRVDAPKS